jgi:hypothetical protein
MNVTYRADTTGHTAGKWYVSASELVSGLQASNTAIEGEYTWCFKLLIL